MYIACTIHSLTHYEISQFFGYNEIGFDSWGTSKHYNRGKIFYAGKDSIHTQVQHPQPIEDSPKKMLPITFTPP